MTLDVATEEFHGLIVRVSNTVCKDFPFVDPEDVIQSVWEELLVNHRDGLNSKSPGMKRLLMDIAMSAAWNIRKEQLRLLSGYAYRLSDVREIMETVFDREDWPSGYTPADARVFERDNMAAVEVRIDAIYAYRDLLGEDKEVLIERYHDKLIPRRGSIEELRLWKALNNLTEAMNGF